MARNESTSNYYTIPENFVDEGRSLNGMVRTRYLIEAVIYGGFFALLSFIIPASSFNSRITISIFFASPAFALGVTGINGEPVSTALRHVHAWFKNRQIMLYDHTPRVLVEAPINKMMNQNDTRAQILSYIERMRDKRLQSRLHQQFILGENFTFASDTDYTREYMDVDKLAEQQEAEVIEAVLEEDDDDDIDIFANADLTSVEPAEPEEPVPDPDIFRLSTPSPEDMLADFSDIKYKEQSTVELTTDGSLEDIFGEENWNV